MDTKIYKLTKANAKEINLALDRLIACTLNEFAAYCSGETADQMFHDQAKIGWRRERLFSRLKAMQAKAEGIDNWLKYCDSDLVAKFFDTGEEDEDIREQLKDQYIKACWYKFINNDTLFRQIKDLYATPGKCMELHHSRGCNPAIALNDWCGDWAYIELVGKYYPVNSK